MYAHSKRTEIHRVLRTSNIPTSSSRRSVSILGETVSSVVREKVDFRSAPVPLEGRRVSLKPRAPPQLALA